MRRCTVLMVFALVFRAGATLPAEQSGIGGYKPTVTPDNRLKYTLETPEFTFTRITAAHGTESEVAITGPTEATVLIRFGGERGISVIRGEQAITLTRGEADNDKVEAIAALLNGRAVTAFRALVGSYERELMNDTAVVTAKTSPFAYSLLLTAAFVSELAGDPNAIERTRDLIRRRISAKLRAAAWRADCVTEYELALVANDDRNTQCLESADNMDSFLARAAERLLCSAEFLAGALSAEAQFVTCSGLSPLKIQ